MSLSIPRKTYADLYGPTKGDRVRLADTELIVEVEKDFAAFAKGLAEKMAPGLDWEKPKGRASAHAADLLAERLLPLAPASTNAPTPSVAPANSTLPVETGKGTQTGAPNFWVLTERANKLI